MSNSDPPKPVHIPGTGKGEEQVKDKGREPGRGRGHRDYRQARDSTSINAEDRAPILPEMPNIPPA